MNRGLRVGLFRAMAPLVLALLSALVKVSLFNLPPAEQTGADWFGWNRVQAIEALASSLAVLTLIFAPLLLLRPRARFLSSWGLNAAGSLFVLVDLLYFRYYSDIFPLSSLSIAWQMPMAWRSILALLRPSDGLLFADVFVAAVCYRVWSRHAAPEAALVRPWRRAAVGGLLALGLVGLVVPVRVVRRDTDDVFYEEFFRFFGVRQIGLPAYRVYELSRAVRTRLAASHNAAPADLARARRLLGARTPTPGPGALFGAARGANVLIIMAESMHAFPLRLTIDGQQVTPILRALADRSLSFENFYGQAGVARTADGEFIALNSLHPLADKPVQVRHATNEFRALPTILAERGYHTLSAHAYYGALYRMREMHPRFGIARSFFLESYDVTEEVGVGMADADFFLQTIPRLVEAPKPFMAYLLTLSTHHPFLIPERYKTLRLGEFAETWVGRYLHTVHYFDWAVGELLRELEHAKLLDRTMVVIFGDHREYSLEPATLARLLSRYAGKTPSTGALDFQLWRAENRLAFLVHLPGDRGAGQRFASVGQVDIAPTLLALLGIADHDMVSLGRDLTRDESGVTVMRDASFVLGDTVCVAPGVYALHRSCGLNSTGVPLDTARFAGAIADARERLAVSDLILKGNLIPRLTPPPDEFPAAIRTRP